MVEFTYVITDEQGLHARPASQFVMAAAKGQEILIKVEGENEAEDAANLKAFVQEHL